MPGLMSCGLHSGAKNPDNRNESKISSRDPGCRVS